MLKLSDRHQMYIGLFLMLLLVVTRGHHFAANGYLPGASWAIFFLAGIYITRKWFLAALFAAAAFLDFAAIAWGGVSSFCISPAYILLIPAYGLLWFFGRKYASVHKENWQTLLPLALFMLVAVVITEIISSGGFYYFSGRFTDPTLIEFGGRLIKYGPGMLSSTAFYVSCAALIHIIAVALKSTTIQDQSTT